MNLDLRRVYVTPFLDWARALRPAHPRRPRAGELEALAFGVLLCFIRTDVDVV